MNLCSDNSRFGILKKHMLGKRFGWKSNVSSSELFEESLLTQKCLREKKHLKQTVWGLQEGSIDLWWLSADCTSHSFVGPATLHRETKELQGNKGKRWFYPTRKPWLLVSSSLTYEIGNYTFAKTCHNLLNNKPGYLL